MIVERCEMPEIFVDGSAIPRFLTVSLIGAFDETNSRYFVLLGRLIDKARNEYTYAREAAQEEERESGMTFAQIERRNKGQFFYTVTLINHLENSLNALSRIYKILRQIKYEYTSPIDTSVKDIRDMIEHMDRDIALAKSGSVSLNISKDARHIEILNSSLCLDELAEEIETLHREIIKIFSDNPKVRIN